MLTAFYNARNEESLRLSDTILSMTGTSSDEEQWQATMQALKVKQGVLSRTGHSDRSMEITDKILSRSRERGDPKWEAEGLRARFILLLDASEMDELESIFKLAYEKAGEAGDNALRGKLMGSYANYLSDCARYEEALEYYEKARKIIKEHRIYNILEAILTNIGNLLSRSGELDKAEKYFRESLDINERTGNRIGAGYAMNGYGVCLAQMGDLEQAEELFNEALSCQIDIGDRNLQSSILNNLGFLAKLQGAFDRSMDYRKESLKIARMVGNRRSESIALLNIGNLHRLLGNPLKSIEFCEEASLLSDQTKDPFSKCHAVSIESMSRLDLNDTVNAAALFRLASGLIEEYDWEPGSIDDFDELLEKMSDEGIQFDPPSNW